MSSLERKITHYPDGTVRQPRKRKIGKRGQPYARILFKETKNGREREYHATKGWRSYRVSA